MNNYASDTQGLPKTDFGEMLKVAHIVGNQVNDIVMSSSTRFSGVQNGNSFVEQMNSLEEIVKAHDFNVFSLEISDEKFIDTAAKMMFLVQARSLIRKDSDADVAELSRIPSFMPTVRDKLSDLVALAKRKDGEYGASWCKRGGIGAWFTSCRKFDRLITQIGHKDMNIWDVSDDINSTEALEETLVDGVNYMLLIIEKRRAIQKHDWLTEATALSQLN